MSIPISDLPFVFDKGFTGDTGSYLSRSTGMGLYLVQKMANDLTIKVEIQTNSYGGTTVTLTVSKSGTSFLSGGVEMQQQSNVTNGQKQILFWYCY